MFAPTPEDVTRPSRTWYLPPIVTLCVFWFLLALGSMLFGTAASAGWAVEPPKRFVAAFAAVLIGVRFAPTMRVRFAFLLVALLGGWSFMDNARLADWVQASPIALVIAASPVAGGLLAALMFSAVVGIARLVRRVNGRRGPSV